ncbi:LmbE-like protein [Coniochaeta ligniaria NRRL 30616]|uniref:N-acetylglucosaminylphosphatidylinositol deacetylase n=1 Tax=Coniochaeta ligniaria NRRL 30616 TaxID=1408157 RepID=A0A1J7I5G8_9PEZI|nr:LmbE-like protein [Coniochaeta ligniaria NRRL 30616]
MDWLLALGIVAIVIPSLYLYTVSVVQTRFPTLRNKRICLLIAHPDDEAMFFAPTVLALTRPETGNHVKILCLSSGNADGLGETRKKELAKSGMTLGLRSEDDVFVVESADFQDSMTATWDTAKIKTLLSSAFAPPHLNSAQSDRPTATIDALITFDAGGVSGHPNHASLYHGARAFVAGLVHGKEGWQPPVDLYTLTSISILRKYASFLDVVPTLAFWAFGSDFKDKKHPAALVFLNGIGNGGITTAWKAMTTAHKSQMVWFRYGWITFSRYMVVNDLRLEKVKAQKAP